MSDIFLSYSSKERATAEKLARVLAKSWSVWWDPKIPPGRRYDEVIREALTDARCVVVLWSKSAVKSDHVRDEADLARTQGKLVPAMIEKTPLPLGFGQIETANLVGWQGDEQHAEFQNLLGELRRRLKPAAPAFPLDLGALSGAGFDLSDIYGATPGTLKSNRPKSPLEDLLGRPADALGSSKPGRTKLPGFADLAKLRLDSPASAGGTVVFEDDFSDNKNHWPERRDHAKIVMRVREGKYEIDHKADRGSCYTWIGTPLDAARDFEIEATIVPFRFRRSLAVKADRQRAFGVLFGGADDDNFHVVMLRGDGDLAVRTNAGGKWHDVVPWTLCMPIYLNRDEPPHTAPTLAIAVRRRGKIAEFMVNGKWIEDAELPSPNGRNVGFSVHNGISVWVKHLKVTQP